MVYSANRCVCGFSGEEKEHHPIALQESALSLLCVEVKIAKPSVL